MDNAVHFSSKQHVHRKERSMLGTGLGVCVRWRRWMCGQRVRVRRRRRRGNHPDTAISLQFMSTQNMIW